MKHTLLHISILMNILTSTASVVRAEVLYPKLTFTYDWRSKAMDKICSVLFGNKLDNETYDQLNAQLPQLMQSWYENAPILFGEVASFFNRGFKQDKRTAIINITHNCGYTSNRFFILGIRQYLNQKLWNRIISCEDDFVTLVFHELLHIWLEENIKGLSPMLIKYAKENISVRDHIHLMAIQKMVYLSINRLDILDCLDESYRLFAPPTYKRAWEIVNDIEGHEAIIDDIVECLKQPIHNKRNVLLFNALESIKCTIESIKCNISMISMLISGNRKPRET